jgi:hypothetical protein
MTVRLRLALTIFVIGVCTALGVLVTVAMAFQRFEHESTYERANAFVGRVVDLHPDLLDLQMRDPDGFTGFLRNLLLFEPDSQLYLTCWPPVAACSPSPASRCGSSRCAKPWPSRATVGERPM